MPNYTILVDLRSCIGCKSCMISCKNENKVTTGISWVNVVEEITQTDKGLELYTFPLSCLHCENPSCAKVCPVHAITKQADGTVQRNAEICIGCKYCISACPFGQSHFNETTKKAEKCTLCKERQEKGLAPACTVNCPTGARFAIEPSKLQVEANRRIEEAKKLGLPYTLYQGEQVGGTHVAYLLPEEVALTGSPQGKSPAGVIGVWQKGIKPVAKAGLGAVAAAVTVAGIVNSRKKGDDQNE